MEKVPGDERKVHLEAGQNGIVYSIHIAVPYTAPNVVNDTTNGTSDANSNINNGTTDNGSNETNTTQPSNNTDTNNTNGSDFTGGRRL